MVGQPAGVACGPREPGGKALRAAAAAAAAAAEFAAAARGSGDFALYMGMTLCTLAEAAVVRLIGAATSLGTSLATA